jgi:oxalate decarboxylase
MTSKTSTPEPIRDNVGGTDPGSRNVELDTQNPDILTPS